jgi:hypothetical protein
LSFIDRVLARLGRQQPMTAEEALAQGSALVEAGKALEAFRLLQREARRMGDRATLEALMTVRRIAAVAAAENASPRSDWPPDLADPFPGRSGIPEIARSELTTAVMGGAILHHGSILVRGMLDREDATNFARKIDDLFVEYDAWVAGNSGSDSPLVPFGMVASDTISGTRPWNRGTGGVFAADCPTLLDDVVQLYERYGLIAAIGGYLGERPVVSVGKTVLRRVDPTNAGDFHQDGAFLGKDVRTINVWIALSDCGVDSPGLEVVDRRLPGIVAPGTGDAYFEWSVGRGVAKQANDGKPFARPAFKAGDALIFDQLMLHATSYAPEMNRQRFALESWFFAPSASAVDQIPLYI